MIQFLSQSVVTLPLAPSIRHALLAAGFSSVADLRGLPPNALSEATGLSLDQILEVQQLSLQQLAPGWRLEGAKSAAELLNESQPSAVSSTSSRDRTNIPRGISTGCTGLDLLLGGGGVACGTVTEFFGVPGVGKTQVGMQLAVNAQLPGHCGGLSGKVIYIDTEGSFMTERLRDMAAAAVSRVAAAGGGGGGGAGVDPGPLSVDMLLSNILYFRVQHYTEQLALTRMLSTLLAAQPEVVLVVIDSITFHFRQDFKDAAQRARLLTGLAQQLAATAEQHQVAVVMMNQVVTRVADHKVDTDAGASGFSSNLGSWLAPALGEGWGQAAASRIALFWEGSTRKALVVKAKHVPAMHQMASTAFMSRSAPGAARWAAAQQQQQQQHMQTMCVPYLVGKQGISDCIHDST